jgi:hypothetical protein
MTRSTLCRYQAPLFFVFSCFLITARFLIDFSSIGASAGLRETASSKNSPQRKSWEDSSVLPHWMKDYVKWHTEEKARLTEANWDQNRYLVVRCLKKDKRCGGASDRIHGLPFLVLLASQMQRLLLIKWEKPARLEEYLIPPVGGLNWTIPDWLDPQLAFGDTAKLVWHDSVQKLLNSSEVLIDTRHQRHDLAVNYYNNHRIGDERTFDEMYHVFWSMVFEPSPGVADLIEKQTLALGLGSGSYSSVHIRSQYKKDNTDNEWLAHNAANCGSEMHPGNPIYVASDSKKMTQAVLKYGTEQGGIVVAQDTKEEMILHLDGGTKYLAGPGERNWNEFPPSAFYDVFADLYMLARASCVAYNSGNFGIWASHISGNHSCSLNHGTKICKWTQGVSQSVKFGKDLQEGNVSCDKFSAATSKISPASSSVSP